MSSIHFVFNHLVIEAAGAHKDIRPPESRQATQRDDFYHFVPETGLMLPPASHFALREGVPENRGIGINWNNKSSKLPRFSRQGQFDLADYKYLQLSQFSMQLSGFTDEAGKDLETQIKATKDLGWTCLSARTIDGTNIHELSEENFAKAADHLDEAGIKVVEFGSLIGNWAKPIRSDFDLTLAEIDRAIPRMQRLGTRFIRIMSYAMEPWGENQQEEERFRRLREIVKRFSDAGLEAIHENCQNYGGFSAEHTLRLVDEVPGMKLIFDTGNPAFTRDRAKPEPHPWQDALEFYRAVKEHVVHVHIKDCINPPEGSTEPAKYTMPGEGQCRLAETLKEMKADGYQGGFAIEPHVATVFHVTDGQEPDWQQCYDSFVAYGRAFEELLGTIY